MAFEDLIGEDFLFYGVSNYMFKLDDVVYEAVEDPIDGYRSCMEEIRVVLGTSAKSEPFYREPITIVQVEKDDGACCTGYKLEDVEHDHVWLRFGTNDADDYYPCFYFNYTPMLIPKTRKPKPQKSTPERYLGAFDRLFDPREW